MNCFDRPLEKKHVIIPLSDYVGQTTGFAFISGTKSMSPTQKSAW